VHHNVYNVIHKSIKSKPISLATGQILHRSSVLSVQNVYHFTFFKFPQRSLHFEKKISVISNA